jgi:S1-C subfamily serine protease
VYARRHGSRGCTEADLGEIPVLDGNPNLELGTNRAVAVRGLTAGGPAASAGVRVGDVVVRLAGTAIASTADLLRTLDADAIGRDLRIEVVRGRDRVELTVRPLELMARR